MLGLIIGDLAAWAWQHDNQFSDEQFAIIIFTEELFKK